MGEGRGPKSQDLKTGDVIYEWSFAKAQRRRPNPALTAAAVCAAVHCTSAAVLCTTEEEFYPRPLEQNPVPATALKKRSKKCVIKKLLDTPDTSTER